MKPPVVVIPAFKPTPTLIDLVKSLTELNVANQFVQKIIVINDGSGDQHQKIFDELMSFSNVTVLNHSKNIGKGQALKTAFDYFLKHHKNSLGVVTMDADGQHLPNDVFRVIEAFIEKPKNLILGKRELKGEIPFLSLMGNTLTRFIFKLLIGQKIYDTQTGLRAIPNHFLKEITCVKSQGYDFELDMLVIAAQKKDMQIIELPVKTIYEPGNPTSHFNPIIDSLKIYFVFLRFVLSSVFTALVDWVVFWIMLKMGYTTLWATILGRFVAGVFNFNFGKNWVFKSSGLFYLEVSKYIALVSVMMCFSYTVIQVLNKNFGVNIFLAKLMTEGSLFLVSFILQRVFVFIKKNTDAELSTDWDAYYSNPGRLAAITRKITAQRLIRCFKNHFNESSNLNLTELGGANSCFYDFIEEKMKPNFYIMIDKNEFGLQKFRENHPKNKNVELKKIDILNESTDFFKSDICFSVGLIEHFNKDDTRKVIEAHFKNVKPGGLVVVTFPTPTFLYLMTRTTLEFLCLWKFYDERPLVFAEVEDTLKNYGKIIQKETIWPIVLTQGLLAVRAFDKTTPDYFCSK